MMERWNTGTLGLYYIALKNIMIHEINKSMNRKADLNYSIIPAFHYSMQAA